MNSFLFLILILPFSLSANTLLLKEEEKASLSQENLGDLLKGARIVPNRNAETGEMDGFILMEVKKGSWFEKLGLKKGDMITKEDFNKLWQ